MENGNEYGKSNAAYWERRRLEDEVQIVKLERELKRLSRKPWRLFSWKRRGKGTCKK